MTAYRSWLRPLAPTWLAPMTLGLLMLGCVGWLVYAVHYEIVAREECERRGGVRIRDVCAKRLDP
jgi:hypothetical protein